MTFYDFLIRHFKKKRKKSCFLKSEKKEKKTKNTYSRTLALAVAEILHGV